MLLRADFASDRQELLRDIAAESDRLYRLVEDLLVLTRIERETLELADQPMLIGPIVDRVVTAERAREPGARLVTRVVEGLPMVRGEDTYVEQIIRNLVGNAIKYGPRGGIVEVVAEPTPSGVAVRVLDEGPGIADDEAESRVRPPLSLAGHRGTGRRVRDRAVREPAPRPGDGRVDLRAATDRGRIRVPPGARGVRGAHRLLAGPARGQVLVRLVDQGAAHLGWIVASGPLARPPGRDGATGGPCGALPAAVVARLVHSANRLSLKRHSSRCACNQLLIWLHAQ